MLIYLAAPLRGETPTEVQENIRRAKAWLAYVLQTYTHVHPIAPWIPCVEVLDDQVAENRWRGMRANLAAIERCDAVWLVGGRISNGMREEAIHARAKGLAVFDFTSIGPEPPPIGERVPGAEPWGV
jgi:hypothetical protein